MACNGIQVQPGCCDCVAVGYNLVDGWALTCLVPGDANDPAQLAAADIAFIGPWNNGCNGAYSYPAPLQTAIKDWVTAGGRLFFTANSYDCFNLGDAANVTNYNNFLGFLGTGMQLENTIPVGCPPSLDCYDAIPATIGIMNGLTSPFTYAQGGEITGGTALAATSIDVPILGCDVPHVFMAAEQIGSGLVVACASSFTLGFCEPGTQNCQFFNRLCKWSVSRILGA